MCSVGAIDLPRSMPLACGRRIPPERRLRWVRSTAGALRRQILRVLPVLTDLVSVDGEYLRESSCS
ncbi:hypothetical protein [Streptomyces sp. KR80]|uniref:hypothetical protein n=1 Tax=Streptomyces sp. KR80 TaxID=3457426 RepID=UPI003FD2D913